MKIIEPPNPIIFDTEHVIFLAGSIEMGIASEWQQKVISDLAECKCTILNPRRKLWNPLKHLWVENITNEKFVEQVDWELDGLEMANHVIFYFDPNTKSPITLMEFGLRISDILGQQLYVCCPEGFWRKGNVDIVCHRYEIPQFPDLDALTNHVRRAIM